MLSARFAPLRLLGVDTGQPRWPTLTLRGESVLVRPPDIDDFSEWAHLREQSRAFLKPWEPPWPMDDLTRNSFRRRIKRYQSEISRDEAYPFFIFGQDGLGLRGGLTLGNVRRGAAQAATLGYWMGAPHAGQGLMQQAVSLVCAHGIKSLALQRIEAACLPENGASIHLLEKAGFEREGFAKSYLNINGERRDHILFALIA